MDVRNIVVVVEEVDASRTALHWALHNIIRYGDIITLLHVYPLTRSKSKTKSRLLRLKGFQLALSFQDICNKFSNTKVEIVVTEEDREGMKIVTSVREIGASMVVFGLHHHSFLYKLAMAHISISSYFNCRVLAIKQPLMSPLSLSPMVSSSTVGGVLDSSTNMDFSQIDMSTLQVPDTPPPKVKYRICPDPTAIIWRLRRSRRRQVTVGGSYMEWGVNNNNDNHYRAAYKDDNKSMMDVTLIPNMDPVNIGLSCSDKQIPANSLKPRKKTMTSVYLKFFETAADGKTRKCKFCGQSYSIATATGNLGRHLANRHPGYDKSGGDAISNSPARPVSVVKKSQPQGKANQVDYDHLNWLLIRWLVLASLPPSTLEEKWLVNSYKFLNPSIQLWPGDKYRTVLEEVYRSMREDVRAMLEQVSSKFSITLDFWTSFEQIFYMSVTCQWIDENWCFQKVLLDICRVPYPCGDAEIYRSLVKVLKLYNIENRVLSCTHDNSPSAMHACHTLKVDLDGQKIGPFCYIPCAARTLNLIIDDGLRSAKQVISKIREFVIELNSSPVISEDFIQLSTAYQEGTWKFPLDVSARWSGNYQMLDLVRKAGKSMDAIIRKYEEMLGSRMLLNSSDKSVANIMHQYLEPFYKTTNNICTSKVPTVGLVLFFMDHISETIATCRESCHSPEWLKNAAEEMAKRARSYISQVCNIFTYMTAILDPRIKGELIPESLNSENFLDEARSHFMRNYSTSHFPSVSSGYNAQEVEDSGSVSFAEEIARKKRRTSMSSATDELTQYLSEAPAPIPTDVLEWWKVNSTRYPRLSVMARDFLAVQATSVVPEELFCGKGDEIDKQRFCMPHDCTQPILCIKSWIQVGIKFKFKSTEIDYERLMELAAAAAATDNSPASSDKKPK